MDKINYLHFSDLHIGDKHHNGLLSQTKKILFDDIEHIISKMSSLDVVFFTGDFVHKGKKEEFDILNDFIGDLWSVFNKCNQDPYLLCIPGNHDIERIDDKNNAVQKVMSNWINEDLKRDFFWNSPNEYHDFIISRFGNYTDWYEKIAIKKPKNIIKGYLPGDFSCSLKIRELNLGVVGLNSAFLQLSNGDFKKKIGVYNNQMSFLFKDKYFEWLQNQDLSILLTHHSTEWFEPDSLNDYNKEIYTEDSFIDHLCGHMHEPNYENNSRNGFQSKRQFVSPSLFGLEYIDDKSIIKRIHGYTGGMYEVESGNITKTIWPRISIQTSSSMKISQNEEFNLEKGTASFTEILKHNGKSSISGTEIIESNLEDLNGASSNLFGKNSIVDKGLIRTLFKEINSHKGIRFQERNTAIDCLKKRKFCWIVSQFGLGEDEFIGTLLLDSNINPGNCFSINCTEVNSIEELIEAFKSTFSKNITQFFEIINKLDRPFLVLRNLNESLIKIVNNLIDFIKTLLDFSTELKLIIISETVPPQSVVDFIELTTLDIPGVKQFVEKSQELQSNFTFLEYEKIHRLSSGIPIYIDKIIEQLKFRVLSDLGELEFPSYNIEGTNSFIPKAILNEIISLQSDESKLGIRRYKLLVVLSLLHNGETFERIRRYDSSLPFHSDDITYLLKNKLIETVQVNSIFDNPNIDVELIKIIRVPRVIRDYISSQLIDDEKVEIYKNVCNLYLGNNWRNNIKLVQPRDSELDLIVHQNLQIAIRFILSFSIEKGIKVESNRMTNISMTLINYFSDRGAYKEAASLTEETLLLIKDVESMEFEKHRTYLMKSLGENLRMTSIHNKSISILKQICDDEKNSLSISDRNDIRLSIAYAYETQDNKEEALKYANLIKQNVNKKESSIYLSAESVILHFIEDEDERIRKLVTLRNKAEKFGFNILKANVILDICKNSKDESQLKQIDKIIKESKNDPYTKVRALIVKAEIVLSTKSLDKINDEDLLGLHLSYSYSFNQRLKSLLNKCHKLAWLYWKKQNRFDQLLNLFRYSSFVWRLYGLIEIEKKYIDELYLNSDFLEWIKFNKNNINSTYYEQRIFALYNINKV